MVRVHRRAVVVSAVREHPDRGGLDVVEDDVAPRPREVRVHDMRPAHVLEVLIIGRVRREVGLFPCPDIVEVDVELSTEEITLPVIVSYFSIVDVGFSSVSA